MTRDQITSLMERLTTMYSYDTVVCECGKVGEFKKPNNILIGDVLERVWDKEEDPLREGHIKLLFLWRKCGFKKSLQQIIEKSGLETVIQSSGTPGIKDGRAIERLKDPNARALFDFLLTLFPK